MSRKTYEKVANINGMFNVLEQQIIHSKDMALFRSEFFYVNHEHRENYEALLVYYGENSVNPIVNGACYILALPEIFNKVDVLNQIYRSHGFMMKMVLLRQCKVLAFLFNILLRRLEVTDVTLFKPSGFTMGMNNWNIAQMRIFWQYSAIVRQEAL